MSVPPERIAYPILFLLVLLAVTLGQRKPEKYRVFDAINDLNDALLGKRRLSWKEIVVWLVVFVVSGALIVSLSLLGVELMNP